MVLIAIAAVEPASATESPQMAPHPIFILIINITTTLLSR